MTIPTPGFNHFARSSPARIIGVDALMGRPIVDRNGKDIGRLHEIMLDLSTGRIAYAAIELRRQVASSTQCVVVPWNAIHCDAQIRELRINAHADWILRAPAILPDGATDRFVHDWGALIHNYFGTRPYWEPPEHAQHS